MTSYPQETKPTTFRVSIAQEILDDLHQRLARTRWTDEVRGADWDYGTNLGYLQDLIDYWRNIFDWRKQETVMNNFAHFRTEVDGIGIHYIHERGKGQKPLPIVLLHGWPSSFLQMLKIIPLLTAARNTGGSFDSFDVIVPSLPGYGFSDRPAEKGVAVHAIAELFSKLMTTTLGYKRFALRGSDLGAGVATEIALSHADLVTGLHLSGSNPYIYQVPPDVSEAEQKFIAASQQFMSQEGAYAMLQSTKPQTLAYSLNDSPAGLAAWIIEKFRTWSDCDGDVEQRFSKDELLANVTLYWATETINSSMRLYYESAHNWSPNAGKRVEIPTAMAMLPKDIAVAPREWEERSYNIARWTELPRGGHFGEWEEPALIAEDIRSFFSSLD